MIYTVTAIRALGGPRVVTAKLEYWEDSFTYNARLEPLLLIACLRSTQLESERRVVQSIRAKADHTRAVIWSAP
ncbi:hypothetical protein NMY22_g3434 [Coprinellus aureogranulatus]|nr:hypothetical protein NMY22_g3434 [Coprinellus aureogranulatus]